MKNPHVTKSTIQAQIKELKDVLQYQTTGQNGDESVNDYISRRIRELESSRDNAIDDIETNILASHKAICAAKNMNEQEAYGNDPALYYTLAINGEAGEMANSIVKNCRNGYNRDRVIESVKSELPDVMIYSYILAYVLDIDLTELVSEKVQIVIERAKSGYYGGPLR